MSKRVVVAMSGGVDSSLAAALLVEQGYDVTGVMMRLWSEVSEGVASANKCCSLDAVDDARRVADQLGIPFYLINVEQPFKQRVVDFTIASYLAGETPNPCIQCNRHIRFDYLYNYALSMGADYLATGHYARVRVVEGKKGNEGNKYTSIQVNKEPSIRVSEENQRSPNRQDLTRNTQYAIRNTNSSPASTPPKTRVTCCMC